MPNRDYIPTREANLVNWSANFNARITAGPATYNLTAPQAAAYNSAHASFVAAYTAATEPSTRTIAAVAAKNVAKANVVALARQYARIIQAAPAVTARQKIDVGLPVHDTGHSPSTAPASAPNLAVLAVFNRTARVRLTDSLSPSRRGKPDGVIGAAVFSYVGATPPASLDDWKAEGNTSRTSVDVVFPTELPPGAQVWLTARWLGPRFQSGPACVPVTAHLPGGAAQAA